MTAVALFFSRNVLISVPRCFWQARTCGSSGLLGSVMMNIPRVAHFLGAIPERSDRTFTQYSLCNVFSPNEFGIFRCSS
jgi:hypothetical protein